MTQTKKRNPFTPIKTTYKLENTFEFWRNSFLFYWVFSFLGHLIEYVWAVFLIIINEPSPLYTIPFFVVAAPYGLGALGIIWFIYPMVQKGKISPIKVYIASVIIATIIEFICGALVVAVMGYNPFWDYSDQFANLFGFVCLRNSLAFGLASLLIVYYIFPFINNLMKKCSQKFLNVSFWVVFIGYIAAQLFRFI